MVIVGVSWQSLACYRCRSPGPGNFPLITTALTKASASFTSRYGIGLLSRKTIWRNSCVDDVKVELFRRNRSNDSWKKKNCYEVCRELDHVPRRGIANMSLLPTGFKGNNLPHGYTNRCGMGVAWGIFGFAHDFIACSGT